MSVPLSCLKQVQFVNFFHKFVLFHTGCFAKAFQRVPQSLTGSITSAADNNVMIASITSDITGNPLSSAEYEFTVSLEIREKVAKVIAQFFFC